MASTKVRNPPWSRDETILALQLFVSTYPRLPDEYNESVTKLSALLRSLGLFSPNHVNDSFRNPAGVALKLQNIASVAKGKGLKNASKTDHEVWKDYSEGKIDLALVVPAILQSAHLLKEHSEIIAPPEEQPIEFVEGALVSKFHFVRERNPNLRRLYLARLVNTELPIQCACCGLKPNPTFGDSSLAVFEIHHTLGLANQGYHKTSLSDLALLCANCHKLLHAIIRSRKSWLLPADLSKLLRESRI